MAISCLQSSKSDYISDLVLSFNKMFGYLLSKKSIFSNFGYKYQQILIIKNSYKHNNGIYR